jgi:hypothetical protein
MVYPTLKLVRQIIRMRQYLFYVEYFEKGLNLLCITLLSLFYNFLLLSQ